MSEPGEQLGEADLARRFEVSRGPLREAMQRLVSEGLLHAITNRGVFVTELTLVDVLDVYRTRSVIERGALEVLLEQLDIPVPESIVTEEVTNHLEGENRLDDDEHRAEVTESTRQQVATQLLLDEIVEKHEIQVGQDELIEYLIMSAQQYGMDPNTFAQALDAQGQVPAIMGEVARRKALATVLESATVKDTAGNVVDLNAAVDTGDDEDEVFSGVTLGGQFRLEF